MCLIISVLWTVCHIISVLWSVCLRISVLWTACLRVVSSPPLWESSCTLPPPKTHQARELLQKFIKHKFFHDESSPTLFIHPIPTSFRPVPCWLPPRHSVRGYSPYRKDVTDNASRLIDLPLPLYSLRTETPNNISLPSLFSKKIYTHTHTYYTPVLCGFCWRLAESISLREFPSLRRTPGTSKRLATKHIVATLRWSDSSVGIATSYGLDGPGIESRWDARFSTPPSPVQTVPGWSSQPPIYNG